VHAALVGADGAERMEIGEDAAAVGAWGMIGHGDKRKPSKRR
jgi:hypothetical protein